MSNSKFSEAISNGKFVLAVQCTPPKSTNATMLKDCVKSVAGKAAAICASESIDGVRLSSLAACVHLANEGAEPILTLLTRDANRIALQSEVVGAASLGITNILVTSGRHQALTDSKTAKGVYDVDPTQFIGIANRMRKSGELADGSKIDAPIDILIGTDTNPYAEPMELQVLTLEATAAAGADFIVTWPVFDLDRFKLWMDETKKRGIHSKTRIIAGIMPFTSAEEASQCGYDIPADLVERLSSASDQRAAGIQIAVETLKAVRGIDGVAGALLMTGENPSLAREVIDASGVGS